MKIEISEDELNALVDAVDMALYDQAEYLKTGNPSADYPGEWTEVAEAKAERLRHIAAFCQRVDRPAMADACMELAADLDDVVKGAAEEDQ
jgi:hypothetical protein